MGWQRKVLLNENVPMYERYAALFGLRNHGDSEAVNAIVAALQAQSALLRHEVCSACLSFIFAEVYESSHSHHVSFGSAGSNADATFKALLWIFLCNLIDIFLQQGFCIASTTHD
jgi:deoxyhypusine monooxygenase